MASLVTSAYRAGLALAPALPSPVAYGAAAALGRQLCRRSAARRLLVERNIRRVLGGEAAQEEVDALVVANFESYSRYWADSFRVSNLSGQQLDDGMDFEGVEHIHAAVDSGNGPIHIMPHLGGWEWAGCWLSRVAGFDVTVVVEAVEPPDLFEFFVELREELGMHIVPLGSGAAKAVLRAVREAHVICLLADRDIDGSGVEVSFFGEKTTMPAGPATLALRSGAPVLPTACYSKPEGGISCIVEAPIPIERRAERLREDVVRITQDIAHALEGLIARAPEQWHLQQPNWPSDHAALEAIGEPRHRS